MNLRDQALLTANALRNMVNDMELTMERSPREIPLRYMTALTQQADDLIKAALSDESAGGDSINALKDQAILAAIERVTADDFCEDLDMRQEDLSGDLKTAHEKISLIYRMAHSHVRAHSCFHVHGDWRQLTAEQATASASEAA